MLDSKILVIIDTDDEIVDNALDEIDGIIYKRGGRKWNIAES